MMNNNLKTGLLLERVELRAWWTKYSLLNTIESPPDNGDEYWKKQISTLKSIENNGGKDNFIQANKFLKLVQNANPNYADEIVSDLAGRVLEIMNAGFWSSSLNPEKNFFGDSRHGVVGHGDINKKNAEIESLLSELRDILQKLQVSEELKDTMVSTLDTRLKKWNSSEGFNTDTYVRLKADQAEDLAKEIINGILKKRTYKAGGWFDPSGQQWLEDAVTENINLFAENPASFTVKRGSRIIDTVFVNSTKEFFDKVNSFNGDYKIYVDSNLYSLIQESNAIMTQVKSGMGFQHLLNKTTERNVISLNKIAFYPKEINEVYIEDLDNPNQRWFKEEANQFSKVLAAYANWALSKKIGRTNIVRNQVYFTEQGFVSASQWMKNSEQLIHFQDDVTSLSRDFLSKNRPYVFIAKDNII